MGSDAVISQDEEEILEKSPLETVNEKQESQPRLGGEGNCSLK